MLIPVSITIFVSMYTPLVAIRFGTSDLLVRSDLLSCHSGSGMRGAYCPDYQMTQGFTKVRWLFSCGLYIFCLLFTLTLRTLACRPQRCR
jgi:hypothetical protein